MPGGQPDDGGRAAPYRGPQETATRTPAIRAGDTPEPLPSVLLDPSGIAGWVLRPADLDRLPVLSTDPPRPLSDGYLPDAESWVPDGEQPTPEVLALMRINRVLGNEGALSAHGVGRVRGLTLDALRRRAAAARAAQPASDPLDPYRTPDGQVGPDTHVTLSYRELRRLVALHLEDCARSMPRARGWEYASARARAMSDGETPLRLREVLE